MKIVIEIDDARFKDIRRIACVQLENYRFKTVEQIIANGTPLPKGHGDLIDRSKIYKAIPAEEDNCTGVGMTLDEMDAYNDGIDAMYSLVHGAPTIIEADKAESEDKE